MTFTKDEEAWFSMGYNFSTIPYYHAKYKNVEWYNFGWVFGILDRTNSLEGMKMDGRVERVKAHRLATGCSMQEAVSHIKRIDKAERKTALLESIYAAEGLLDIKRVMTKIVEELM